MDTVLSQLERDRRWNALQAAMERADLGALVFVANDYNGHKGSVRYVADHRLFAFYSYAVMGRDREPTMILPAGMLGARRGGWVEDYRFVPSMAGELVSVLGELGSPERVGIVGMTQIMRVEDYLYLTENLNGTELVDAGPLFEEVRAVKSPEEVRGAEEAAYILDRCLDRMLEIVRPGVTKREIAAETYRTCAELGGRDPIFLTMDNLAPEGKERTRWSPPSDDAIAPGELLNYSFECIGPSGYWAELCRMVTFSEPSEEVLAVHAAIADAMEGARDALRPGVQPAQVQRAMVEAGAAAGMHPGYLMGHAIGQDVIEQPMIGLDTIEEVDEPSGPTEALPELMVFVIHPLLVPDDRGIAGYMADTYVVEADGARRLSGRPLDLLQLPG